MKMKGHAPTNTGVVDIGCRLRELRKEHGLSIRAMAKKSHLSVNTLSLIENGRSSPSVSTLQQIALTLDIPITSFFEIELPNSMIVFQKAGQRLQGNFTHGTLEDLGAGLFAMNIEPFLVMLEPEEGSGESSMVHGGVEFVFCLKGRLLYTIENQTFLLEPGDSLLFEASQPHCWKNADTTPTRSLLILIPTQSKRIEQL
jgi:transcriptional regulator with XRE-family HTH domain